MAAEDQTAWHTLEWTVAAAQLGTDPLCRLSSGEATARQARFEPNARHQPSSVIRRRVIDLPQSGAGNLTYGASISLPLLSEGRQRRVVGKSANDTAACMAHADR